MFRGRQAVMGLALLSGALQPDDRVRVDYDDVQLTFDVDKAAADGMEEVEEPESQPAHA